MTYQKLSNSEEDLTSAEEISDEQKTAVEDRGENEKPPSRFDKTIATYRSFFFMFFFGFGTCFPYMGIYFKQIGLAAGYVGLLGGLRPVIQFLSGPLWAMIADKYRARKLILLFSIFSWLVMTMALVIPRPRNTRCVQLNQSDSMTAFQLKRQSRLYQSNTILSYIYQPPPHHPTLHQANYSHIPEQAVQTNLQAKDGRTQKIVHDPDEVYRVFLILLVLIVVGEFLESPSFIMIDTAVLQYLGTKRTDYGKTRMFGSMGYALASFTAGAVLDRVRYTYCGKSMTNYTVMFYMFAVFMLIALLYVIFFFHFEYSESFEERRSPSEVYALFMSLQYGVFLITAWFLGFSHGAIDSFLNWYLEDLGASKMMMGVATALRGFAIIGAFFFSGCIISYLGHARVVAFSLISYTVSFFAYTLLPGPWWAIPVEVFQGVTFAVSWATCVTYLTAACPEHGIATMQGILQGVYWGIGSGSGAIVAGLCVGRFGVVRSFRAGGVACGIALVLFQLVQFIINRRERRTQVA